MHALNTSSIDNVPANRSMVGDPRPSVSCFQNDWRLALGSFIIDSVGFSATHSMATFLRDLPNFYVTHGSRNFKEGGMIGVNNLSVADFFSQMLEVETAYDNCVAIHCIFDPANTQQEAKKNNVTFYGLCRKSTKKQALSCFYWAAKKFLGGEVSMSAVAIGTLNQHSDSFSKLNLQPNYITALMFYSLERVVRYNLSLADHSSGLIFMEDFLAHPENLLELLGAELSDNQSLSAPRTVSHRQQTSDYDFLVNCEDTLDILANALTFEFHGDQIKAEDVYHLISRKNVLAV